MIIIQLSLLGFTAGPTVSTPQVHQRDSPHLGGLLVPVRRQPWPTHRCEAAPGGRLVGFGVMHLDGPLVSVQS